LELALIIIEFVILIACIVVGARMGGAGLGAMGGVGLAIFCFGFHMKPGDIPIDVVFMIACVVTAAACLQASGGMDYLIYLASKALRKHPKHITFIAPAITYIFTFCAGTGHVAYSVLPIIAEVAFENGIRPERPMSIATIASQQAITACPISAATVALLGVLDPLGITLPQIMMVCVPSTVLGCAVAAILCSRMGKELPDDPEYKRRLEAGLKPIGEDLNDSYEPTAKNKLSVVFFLVGALLVVLMGMFPDLRPSIDGTRMGMPTAIEVVMLCAAALMMLFCGAKGGEVAAGSVFQAGMNAVVAILGIAWMGDTFFQNNKTFIVDGLEGIVASAPWLFAIALFVLSILMYSQAATTKTLMPVGLALGLSPALLIGMFPAVNGYFFIPNYPTVVAAINFDRTGSTHVGKYVLNHSFMMPGVVACVIGVAAGLGLAMVMIPS